MEGITFHPHRPLAANARHRRVAVYKWPKPANKSVRCITCGKVRKENSMKIWDVPNEVFMCNEECEKNRPDRWS